MAATKQLKIADFFVRSTQKRKISESGCVEGPEIGSESTDGKENDVTVAKVLANNDDKVVPTKVAKLSCSEAEVNGNCTPLPDLKQIAEKPSSSPFKFSMGSGMMETGWRRALGDELNKSYMKDIFKFVESQYEKNIKVFPPRKLIFNAFNLTPFNDVRVVLIGQDPYHNDGQAHGLCFSVPKGVTPPPSLKNIYRELADEYPDFRVPDHGCLESWARQGVFLLNATLTVEAHKANSHSAIGWQKFTDQVIRRVSERSSSGVVFLLWGGFAHKKEALIDRKRHRVIKTAHPSPLSYMRFKGCRCFTATNRALVELGREPIVWNCL